MSNFEKIIRKFIIKNFVLDYRFKTYKGVIGFSRASFILMNLLLIIMLRVDTNINLFYIPTLLFVLSWVAIVYLLIKPVKEEDIKFLDNSQLQQYNYFKYKIVDNNIEVEKNNIKLYIQILMFISTLFYFIIKYSI